MGSNIAAFSSTITITVTMSKMLLLLCLTLTLTMASTEPRRFAALVPLAPSPQSGCSTEQVLACGAEITAAFYDCVATADILGCMEDIIGASDCWVCACDVLEWFGLMTCDL